MLNFKMFILSLVVSFSFLGIVGLKVHVHDLQQEISDLENVRSKSLEEVQVLRAEWSNLNRPERLKSLSEQYLKFEHINTKKVKYLGENKEEPKLVPVKNTGENSLVHWRYKSRDMILKSGKRR